MNRLITKKRVTSVVLLPLDPPAAITLGIAFLPAMPLPLPCENSLNMPCHYNTSTNNWMIKLAS